MHRHQWIIFLPNFILSRLYVTLYLISYCVFHFNWCRVYTYICIYMRIYLCVSVYIYICLCACECKKPCIHDYMYVFYVCSFYVCWFYEFFYLWLLGQRWPNKEVQTKTISISKHTSDNFVYEYTDIVPGSPLEMSAILFKPRYATM